MRWLVVSIALLSPLPLSAQLGCPDSITTFGSTAARPDRPPDVILRATVQARSIRFETSPVLGVRKLGCVPWDTVIVTERVNLPDTIVPGETYRDVRVGVEIHSWFKLRCSPQLLAGMPLVLRPDSTRPALIRPDSTPSAIPSDSTRTQGANDSCARLLSPRD
jgi:hypothetical protein